MEVKANEVNQTPQTTKEKSPQEQIQSEKKPVETEPKYELINNVNYII